MHNIFVTAVHFLNINTEIIKKKTALARYKMLKRRSVKIEAVKSMLTLGGIWFRAKYKVWHRLVVIRARRVRREMRFSITDGCVS